MWYINEITNSMDFKRADNFILWKRYTNHPKSIAELAICALRDLWSTCTDSHQVQTKDIGLHDVDEYNIFKSKWYWNKTGLNVKQF